MATLSAVASVTAACVRPSTTEVLIWSTRKTPRTATTVTEITSVLVMTWSWSERRHVLRTMPTARLARRLTPPRIWRIVLRRGLLFDGNMRKGKTYAGPAL
ncbi:hypothetical protein GCM10018965_060010 [Nonomuraea roseola]